MAETGRFWSVTFSERFEVRCAVKAGELVRSGRIGRVVQTLGLGPHREGDRAHLAGGAGRPDWFYDAARTGGILTDIASHQIDQFLWFTGSDTAEVVSSTVANYTHPDSPGMQDFGELTLRYDHAHGYVRVDWYTPQGLPTWGDGRLVILGTEGYIELRKYVDIAGRPGRDHLFVVDGTGTEYVDCSDVELSYYPDLVHDVVHRTETAVPAGPHLRGDEAGAAGPANSNGERFRGVQSGGGRQTDRLRVGIVGCGGIGNSHARAYVANSGSIWSGSST